MKLLEELLLCVWGYLQMLGIMALLCVVGIIYIGSL